ncbi:DUF5979 domain-containing protein [Homoserinimonas sp. OAct 916]|uniref:DUF5979 domain-containing protein n=1 Tax=Homoserinimonas sp. OAct 916 TaxID=2211450 RepID=UPI0013008675|nr:DUF5979 domain-containing protein [Homoserinimonas sp. OAct 916]
MKKNSRTRTVWRAAWAMVLSVALAGPMAGSFANVAFAAEGAPEYLTVEKHVDNHELAPGEPFTYEIDVRCSEQSCIAANLTDALPPQLAGYAIQSVDMVPGDSVVPRNVRWIVGGETSANHPAIATADTVLSVDFTGVTSAPTGVGMQSGQNLTVSITLQVPDTVEPGSIEITNTATTSATNSAPDSSSAVITVTNPILIGVGATKNWSPSTQSFDEGAASTIGLQVTNTSNVPVKTLVLQEPKAAENGDTQLDASNPFTITDFAGFANATLPAGAESVQVDHFLKQADGTWEWVEGTPDTALEFPSGIDPATGGIRITYAGEAIAPGAAGSVDLGLALRARHRNTDADLSLGTHEVKNIVQGTAVPGDDRDPVSEIATADYKVTPVAIDTSITKNIAPDRISAGESSIASITATNESAGGVKELTISDLGYFTEEITFGGFTAAPSWPTGATGAVVTYHALDGTPSGTVTFAENEVPAAPGTKISGFEIVYTAAVGHISSASSSTVTFTIDTTEAAVLAPATSLVTTNTATSKVTASNDQTATATDSDVLTLLQPAIAVTLTKSVRPSIPVQAGDPVISKLEAKLTTSSDYVTTTQIVVEDSLVNPESTSEFWNAFNLSAVAPTQVPAQTALTIQVQSSDGSWQTLEVFPSTPAAFIAQMTKTEIEAALPSGVNITDLTGIRFTFDNAAGFSADTNVTPYVVSEARGALRAGGGVTAVAAVNPMPVEYTNTATTTGTGATDIGTPLEDTDTDTGTAQIIAYPGGPGGPGTANIEKSWDKNSVSAQSGERASTTLDWRVGRGFETVTIADPSTDPINPPDPANSVFAAFDLVGVNAIAASNTEFSNGWFLKYDTITAVELWSTSAGAWQAAATTPHNGWVHNGAFAGYNLTEAERADTTGVRLVLAENSDARHAAAEIGSAFDPYAPAPGTGVAASSADRQFTLSWQIRNIQRPATPDVAFVTSTAVYNSADAGVVDNTVSIDAKPSTGDSVRDTANDTIFIIDPPTGVSVTKTVTPTTPIFVPFAGTDAEDYPNATFTLTAKNDSIAAASYVRVTDPATCEDTVPVEQCQTPGTATGAVQNPFSAVVDNNVSTVAGFGSPFQQFDLKNVTIAASISNQVDLSASTVWLLRYSGGEFSEQESTATAVNAMSAADLATVVGISVTFQGADPATTAGTITQANNLTVVLDTQLRKTLRSTGAPQVLAAGKSVDVLNRVFAQSYDPVLFPGPDGQTNGARANATARLTGGDLNVGPSKSVTPTSLTEPTRGTEITVTLGANQGVAPVSTLAPAEVRLQDDSVSSPEFWNQFDFTGLGTIVAPAGADRVQVDVFGPFGTDDVLEWATGSPAAVADAEVSIDASEYSDVQGIRFTFTRSDGGYFSDSLPAPTWSSTARFTVQLRDVYRESNEAVVLAGSVDNTVVVQSLRKDGEESEERAATARVNLSPGTFQLQVNKLTNNGNRVANVGDLVPWDLTFRNNGTGFLTIAELRDFLPAELLYTGVEPVYSGPAGGLSTDVTLVQDGQKLVFTWPEEGRRMAPGESFSIRVALELQPGLASGGHAVNEMTVTTDQVLQSCSNTVPTGATTDAWTNDKTTCGTTDYVAPKSGPNLFTVKGVSGSLPGAYNPGNANQTCAATLSATDGDYFRAPCVAHSKIGGTDDWVLRAINAGTVTVDSVTIFDQLPVAGDQFLISGADRSSAYRPQMIAGTLKVTAPSGTNSTIEVATSSGVCAGTWGNLLNHEPCAQNGENWAPVDSSTDWSAVSGLRVTLDFSETAARVLAAGEFVDVTFSTINVPASEADPTGAPSAVPGTDSLAWNQFGAKYQHTGRTEASKLSPGRVGVHLLFGAIEIVKDVSGPAAGYAPDEFLADVQCSIEDVDLDMSSFETITLSSENEFTQRIDGIPFGASCTVTEQGEVGEFGETSRTGTPVTLLVNNVTTADDAVPAGQIATIGNVYEFSGLSVTKLVETEADLGEFGPFNFTLSCESSLGSPVTFDENGSTLLEFALAGGDTFTAPENTIPVGSTCSLAEVGTSAADDIVIVGTDVTDGGDGSATIGVGAVHAEVTVTNGYDSGILTVTKVVDGDGAQLYGAGPFEFNVLCTYQGQKLLSATFELDANSSRTFGTFPAGTSCAVEETATGGANLTVLDPADGIVVIPSTAEGDDSVAEVAMTATNTFQLGSLQLEKVVDGAGAKLYGAGPFTADVSCTWEKDGETLAIPLANDGMVQLSEANDYTSVIGNLIVGATCAVEETATGGATHSALSPADGVVTITDSIEAPVTVTLTNTFDVTALQVTKVVEGNLAAEGADGPFTVSLQCTWPVDGVDEPVAIPGGAERLLQAPDTLVVSYDDLPVGATCDLTETETQGADGTSITVQVAGSDTVKTEGVTATIELAGTGDAENAQATITNTFDADLSDDGDEGPPGDGGDGPLGDGIATTGANIGLLPLISGILILGGGLIVGAMYLIRRRREQVGQN